MFQHAWSGTGLPPKFNASGSSSEEPLGVNNSQSKDSKPKLGESGTGREKGKGRGRGSGRGKGDKKDSNKQPKKKHEEEDDDDDDNVDGPERLGQGGKDDDDDDDCDADGCAADDAKPKKRPAGQSSRATKNKKGRTLLNKTDSTWMAFS